MTGVLLASNGLDALAGHRQDLVKYGRRLHRLGYTPGSSGNLSVRIGPGSILATPTGCGKFQLKPEDMVLVDLEGNQLSGAKRVTSEIAMHLAVYRMREDVQAVIHAHPPTATGYACSGRALDAPLCAEAVMTLGPVPLAPYATTGTDQLATSLRPFIPGHCAVLMANHGAVTYGDSLLDAFHKMETLEHFAKICLVTDQLGTPHLLEQDSVRELLSAKDRYLRNSR